MSATAVSLSSDNMQAMAAASDVTAAPTQQPRLAYRADECKTEDVTLNIKGVAVPGKRFMHPESSSYVSVPVFFLEAIEEVRERKDMEISKNDFQKLMRKIAVDKYCISSENEPQYYARWSEMSSLGYRQNPNWIAWLQAFTVEGNARFYRCFRDGEIPELTRMLTRENSPTYKGGVREKKSKAGTDLESLMKQIKEAQDRLEELKQTITAPTPAAATTPTEEAAEPVAEEVVTEEVEVTEEPVTEEPVVEEVATEEVVVTEEPVAEEVATEEAVVAEEPVVEENVKPEPKIAQLKPNIKKGGKKKPPITKHQGGV